MGSFWLYSQRAVKRASTWWGVGAVGHPSWHKLLPVFAFTRTSKSQSPSFHPCFHLLFFPFFLSISSSVSPSWVPRPFVWPCPTLPSSTLLPRTLTRHLTRITWRQTAHVLHITASVFHFSPKADLLVSTALKTEFSTFADQPRNDVIMPGLKHCINVQKWCSYWFSGSSASYFCHISRKCLCVLLEASMVFSFALVGE